LEVTAALEATFFTGRVLEAGAGAVPVATFFTGRVFEAGAGATLVTTFFTGRVLAIDSDNI